MNLPESELLDDVLLSMVEGIGSRTFCRLMEHFGSSTAILDLSRSDLRGFDFLKKDTAERLLSARRELDPTHIVELCRREGIEILSYRDPRYPAPLRTIHDPPPLLYVRGRLLPEDEFALAVVGTRRISAYGRKQTRKLVAALTQAGFTIVSGLARGIDAVAHRSTLESGGRTLAVLGSGHLSLYPPEHGDLAAEIVESGGAILSEYPPLHPSASWTFPQRNRIVCGLSLGVLVVEAPLRSGSMITARLAGEQGRDVFAVPGPIDSEVSRGCHQLIRDGACLVTSSDDVLESLGPLSRPVGPIRHPNETTLNEIEQAVLGHIATTPTALETICEAAGLSTHQVRAALGVLEDKRIIRRVRDDVVVRIG